VIVLDTGGLYAALDANETLHGRAVAALVAATPPRLVSPFVLAELDYLIGSRVGHQAQMALVDEVARGAYQLEVFSSEDVGHARRIMERYADLRIGLADASVVVLANRHRTLELLCTDERHFRALRGTGGRAFRLLPFDAAL
jgi:predicted nucleic acid-binding protein